MSTRPSRRWSATFACAIVAVAAGVPAAALAVEGEPIVLRLGVTQSARPPELNPFLTTSGMGYVLIADRYDLLVSFGPDLTPAPGLAETWETSEDGLTWTYHIREGATWQDGQPVTAEDVRFTLQYIIDSHDPAYTGPHAPNGNDVRGPGGEPNGSADFPLTLFDNYIDLDGGFDQMRIESIAAPDERTVVITTREPIITLAQMFIPMLPKHIWEQITFEQANDAISIEQAIGSGPYRIVEAEPRQFWRLVAHEGYWGGRPHVDELVYQYFDNGEAQVNALREGSVDFLNNVPPTLVSALEGDPNITINRAASFDFAELGFNSWDPTPERFETEGNTEIDRGPTTGSMGDPWLTRPEVRAALAGLLDKQHLVEHALNGFGTPGVSIMAPTIPFYHYAPPEGDPVAFPAYTDEAGRAAARAQAEQRFRDAMAALGFSDTDGNGILNAPDTPEAQAFDPEGAGADWSLRLFVREDDEEDKLAGELMEGWFETAGVDIDLQQVTEDPGLYDATYPSASNADMDMYIWGWGPDPDPDFIFSVFTCGQINGWQDANYCDPAYDEQYRASRTATNLDERQQIILDLQDKLYHESPYAILWYPDTVEAYRSDRIEGLFPLPRVGGELWSTYGMGPWGSRVTVGPIGAAGEEQVPPAAPEPSPSPGTSPEPSPGEPTASPGPGETTEPGATEAPVTEPPEATPAPTSGATPTPVATPAPSPTTPSGTGGDSTPILLVAAAAAALGALALWWMRRRRVDEDDED
jgi:peptide/nickel transport system substrate-binding protein